MGFSQLDPYTIVFMVLLLYIHSTNIPEHLCTATLCWMSVILGTGDCVWGLGTFYACGFLQDLGSFLKADSELGSDCVKAVVENDQFFLINEIHWRSLMRQ